jgi:hypothetical protein
LLFVVGKGLLFPAAAVPVARVVPAAAGFGFAETAGLGGFLAKAA